MPSSRKEVCVALKLYRRRDQDRIDATAAQRAREDDSPRLAREVPALRTLRIQFEDRRAGSGLTAMTYSKPIVVASAAASFEIRCMEPRCDGRHDLTHRILSALRRGQPSFSDESACNGIVGELQCDHVLMYVCTATYAG
jgi:hypothetical protein